MRDANVSQFSLCAAFTLMAAPPQQPKHLFPSPDRCYLGTSVHTRLAVEEGVVRVQARLAARSKVQSRLEAVLDARIMSREDAGKLRGDIQRLFSASTRAARFAGPCFGSSREPTVPAWMTRTFWCSKHSAGLVLSVRPRDISVWGAPKPCVLIYTDASFKGVGDVFASPLSTAWRHMQGVT